MEHQGNWKLRGDSSALRSDMSLLTRAIAAAGEPILIVDVDDRIVWANRAFSELCGLPTNIVPEIKCEMFDPLPAYAIARNSARHCDSSASRTELTRLTGSRADGTRFIAEAVVTPMMSDGAVTHFVAVIHDVTQTAAALEKEKVRTSQDELTGLACRSHILGLLHSAFMAPQKPRQVLAVLFIDLDGFKRINDSFGHHVGDCLLKAVAARLAGVVRGSDTVARLGGDEFLIFLPAVCRRKSARQIGTHIVQQLSRPFAIGQALHHVSASVGIAFRPDHGETAELLVIRADEAMYLAKGRGGNQVAVATHRRDSVHQTRFQPV